MWLSDMVSSGVLLTAWRTEDTGELHFTYATSNGLRVRKMVEDPIASTPDSGILDSIDCNWVWIRIHSTPWSIPSCLPVVHSPYSLPWL
ncbi:MAG: hypothetical protein Ct9H90mP16_17520 [Candidatus Poseidoniales archaeon]|nr:MAG: hypothetical protein Ct9H90mP16_17520 [Candidatus Poseidoniales archaeon]